MAEVEVPVELIFEILTRLPVKPLFRFKCVSKPWNSLISSPSFITRHLKSNPNPSIVVSFRDSIFSASIPENININSTSDIHFSKVNPPFKLFSRWLEPDFNLIDSCNGIFLVSNLHGSMDMYLYNPANNTHRSLPLIPTDKRHDKYLGLWYDSPTDDYKVIRVFHDPGENLEVFVYSMRENIWKFIKGNSGSFQKFFLREVRGIGADGVFRFMVDDKPVLMCFDVRTGVFSILEFPELDSYDFDITVMVGLWELSGCLCLIVNYLSWDSDYQLLYVDVWEMREHEKEVSWVKLFRIRRSEVVEKDKSCTYIKLLGYSKNKGKVLLEVDRDWFGWYDLVTKSVQKVKTQGLPDWGWCDMAMTHVESLVSVRNDKAKHRRFKGVQAKAMINHH